MEVLRGPQGTLFGRNTPAGIIKFESRKPAFEDSGYGRLTYGRFNFLSLEAVNNATLVEDVLAVRIALLYERRDGWINNTFTREPKALEDFEDVAGRFQILYTPTSRFEALINVHARDLNGTARVFRANIIQPGTDRLVNDFDRFRVAQDGENAQDLRQLGSVMRLNYDLGPVTLTSVTGYEFLTTLSRGDIDGGVGINPNSFPGVIPFPAQTADAIPRLHQITQELRLATTDWDRFNFQAGLFYFYEDLDIDSFSFDTLGGGALEREARQTQQTNAFGAFASATFDPIPSLRLGAGIRYSNDRKDFRAERLLPELAAQTASPEANFINWDATVRYTPWLGKTLFFRAASGFRAPSIQGRLLFDIDQNTPAQISVADSEQILSFELGIKTEWWERRARINLTGFYYTLSDQQLTAVGGTSNNNTLINADTTIGAGAELEAEILPVSNLLVRVGLSFNKTEIQDDTLAVAPCLAPCTVLNPAGSVPGTVRIDGNSLPHAPEWIANVSLRYDLPIGETDTLFLFTDWAFRSRVYFFLYESEEFTDPSLLEGGARIGYAYDGSRVEVAAFVRNLTDDLSRTGGVDFNNLTGFVNEPRTWGLEGRFFF